MTDTVRVKEYAAPPVDEREALRYGGVRGEADERLYALFERCVREASPLLSYRVCYAACTAEECIAALSEYTDLTARLCGAKYVVLFAATVGVGIDRLAARYAQLAPTQALLLQGLGAERVESLCDAFCREVNEGCAPYGMTAGTRFSPGYAELPLEAQRTLVRLLDTHRKIGLALTDGLLLSPTKSVTALIPIGENVRSHRPCEGCTQENCAYRKRKV